MNLVSEMILVQDFRYLMRFFEKFYLTQKQSVKILKLSLQNREMSNQDDDSNFLVFNLQYLGKHAPHDTKTSFQNGHLK